MNSDISIRIHTKNSNVFWMKIGIRITITTNCAEFFICSEKLIQMMKSQNLLRKDLRDILKKLQDDRRFEGCDRTVRGNKDMV